MIDLYVDKSEKAEKVGMGGLDRIRGLPSRYDLVVLIISMFPPMSHQAFSLIRCVDRVFI